MVLPLDAWSDQNDQVGESVQDSFKRAKELIVMDEIKVFTRQIRGKKTASKYNFLQERRDGVN